MTDPLLLLSAVLLKDLYERTNQLEYIHDGVLLLAHGLKKSAYNFQMKLHLMDFYNILGAVKPAGGLYIMYLYDMC